MLYAYKKQIIVIAVLITAGLIGLGAYKYVRSFQYVTVTYAANEGTVQLYRKNGNSQTPIAVKNNVPLKVKKGEYTVKATGPRIASIDEPLTVGETPVTKALKFSFSDEYLAQLLPSERSAVQASIMAAYPQLQSLYTVSREKLYDRGEWFGEILTYKGSDTINRDTLRLLAHKVGDSWKLLTAPPTPLLSTSDFPDAPRSVIVDINQPAPLPGTSNSPALDANGNTSGNYD